ncbi:hypothetical protein IE81DRAFT_292854 [Ceraceosorus guamensis]|uniref:Breast carcinoma amplified sequence 2 n=1 Tax=Ceraceosorus guamensis TaxID=1522189 RepID=A0A316VZ83_9BASI|nr:hypothetical protein IE81DRAFT_292854 [Ceraceosorus guamensis]PWN40805.1 hypothetical protein IE81DRAFT_292854 [Ceraceosorus guamensis]
MSLIVPSSSQGEGSSHAVTQRAAYDALPYHDRELENVPGLKSRVDKEIQAELQSIAARDKASGGAIGVVKDRLPVEPKLFEHRSDLQAELSRIAEGNKTKAIDGSRYALSSPSGNAASDAHAWDKALSQAEAALGHANVRRSNLELEKKFGANLWRLHNFQQESMLRQYEKAVEDMRTQTADLNRSRKMSQTQGGETLSRLESKWAECISRNLQVEVATLQGLAEVEELKGKREELQTRLAQLDAEAR